MDSEWMRSSSLQGVDKIIEDLGGDPEQVCDAAGVALVMVKYGTHFLPIEQVVRFLNYCSQLFQIEGFGLRLGIQQNFSALGPAWALLQNSADIGEMLRDLARHFVLHTNAASLSCRNTVDGLKLSYSLAGGGLYNERQLVEMAFALLCGQLRLMAPQARWDQVTVQFAHSSPSDLSLHRLVLGPNINFNQEINAIAFDQQFLSQPIARADRNHRHLIKTQLDRRVAEIPKSAVHDVEVAIRELLLESSACTLESVSKKLAMSVRTIQRRLLLENTNFIEIRDRVRAAIALQLLRDSNLKAIQIAEVLGFSGLTVFSRFFKRQHGETMKEVKLKLKQKKPPLNSLDFWQ